MPSFVKSDRGVVRVEVDRIGEGVVVVSAEDSPRENCVAGGGEQSERVPPADSDFFVVRQSSPLAKRVILVEADFCSAEVVLLNIFRDGVFGFGRDPVVINSVVPEKYLGGNTDDPSCSVDQQIGPAAFDVRCPGAGRSMDAAGPDVYA